MWSEDDLDIIASGPTVPDAGTFADCLTVVRRYGIAGQLPAPVMARLEAGAAGRIPETPKAGEAAFASTKNIVVGRNLDALTAARQKAETLGYQSLVLSSRVQGETRHVAAMHAAIAREVRQSGHPLSPPACILSGGGDHRDNDRLWQRGGATRNSPWQRPWTSTAVPTRSSSAVAPTAPTALPMPPGPLPMAPRSAGPKPAGSIPAGIWTPMTPTRSLNGLKIF